jgi:hypothetical protein
MEAAAAPQLADTVDRPSEPDGPGSVDVSYWNVTSIPPIDAKPEQADVGAYLKSASTGPGRIYAPISKALGSCLVGSN